MLGDSKAGGHSRPESGQVPGGRDISAEKLARQAGLGSGEAGYQVLLHDLALKMPTLLDHSGVGSRNSSL